MTRTAAVVTVSDGVHHGTRVDGGGDGVTRYLVDAGYVVVARVVVPDEMSAISEAIVEACESARLVVTTGGTGFGPRDVTPEASVEVIERLAPGLQLAMLEAGRRATPMAALSRAVAGSRGTSLILNLPGSPKGAIENLAAVIELIPHALDLLAGDTEHS